MARAIVHFVADLFVHVETSVRGDVCTRLTSSSPFEQHVKKCMCNSEPCLWLLLQARSSSLRTAKGRWRLRMLKCLTCLCVGRKVRGCACTSVHKLIMMHEIFRFRTLWWHSPTDNHQASKERYICHTALVLQVGFHFQAFKNKKHIESRREYE